MKSYIVHCVQYYKADIYPIRCSSYNEKSSAVAISRSDNSIEVWDLRHSPYQKQVFPCFQGNSVESLAWCGNRLFSAGLASYILEYSFCSLLPKSCTTSVGGPVWCLNFSKDERYLAVGTEDGFINLFRVTDDSIEFERSFNSQEGRVLCLAWHKSGHFIVSGSTDTIRIWNVESGHVVDRILVGRVQKHVETTVWCLTVLGNGTIVSGDSNGRTCFWDMKTTTLIHEARDHKADVLALCSSKDEKSIYASGIDSVIIQYNQVHLKQPKSSETSWVRSYQNVIHSNDIMTLSVTDSYLLSGGVDSYLTMSSHSPRLTLRYPPFLQNGAVHLASTSRCLLFRYSKTLELWTLGRAATPEKNAGNAEFVPLKENVTKVLELSAKDGETIVCCAVSPDVQWLAYSTLESLRLFHLQLKPAVKMHKVKHLPAECIPATRLCFTSSGNKLVVANGSKVTLLGTDRSSPIFLHSFVTNSESFISHLCCSSIAEHVALAYLDGTVVVHDLQDGTSLCSLPQHRCAATAISFHPQTGSLFAAYADHKVVEYDIFNKSYTPWSRNVMKSLTPFVNVHFPVLGITFDGSGAVFLYNDDTIFSIQVDQLVPSSAKKSRQPQDKNHESNVKSLVINKSNRYKHLLAFMQLENEEMVAVKISPSTIKTQLPPALRRKKFGT